MFKEDHVFKELGVGFFSQVFLHREYPEYAIKVCYREADSWPFFAKYCMDNADNLEVNFLLPRIHAFHKISSRGLYIAVVDKLETISPHGNIVDEHLVNPVAARQIHSIAAGFNESGSSAWRNLSKCKVLDDKYLRAASMIYDDLKMFCTIDLHGGNLMKDAEGDIIVTDPVSFSPKESSEAKIEELDCMLRGVQYDGEKALPKHVVRELEQEREHNRLQRLHTEEKRKRDLSLHNFINKVGQYVDRAQVIKDRDIIGRDLVPNIFGDLAKLEEMAGVRGRQADLIMHDFASLELKVMAIQAKEDGIPSNVGVVKRNAFLARKLGHHV